MGHEQWECPDGACLYCYEGNDPTDLEQLFELMHTTTLSYRWAKLMFTINEWYHSPERVRTAALTATVVIVMGALIVWANAYGIARVTP